MRPPDSIELEEAIILFLGFVPMASFLVQLILAALASRSAEAEGHKTPALPHAWLKSCPETSRRMGTRLGVVGQVDTGPLV